MTRSKERAFLCSAICSCNFLVFRVSVLDTLPVPTHACAGSIGILPAEDSDKEEDDADDEEEEEDEQEEEEEDEECGSVVDDEHPPIPKVPPRPLKPPVAPPKSTSDPVDDSVTGT